MRKGLSVSVIIPALNEERSIAQVLDAIPDWVDDVVVADNGSQDRTAEIAEAHGARGGAGAKAGLWIRLFGGDVGLGVAGHGGFSRWRF